MSIGAKIAIFLALFGIALVMWTCCAMAGIHDDWENRR